MAYATRVTYKPEGQEEMYVEPYWWSIAELKKSYSFKKTVNYYVDYELLVKKSELQKIAKTQESSLSGVYSSSQWSSQNTATQEKLQNIIDRMKEDETALIWIYEWESGLD